MTRFLFLCLTTLFSLTFLMSSCTHQEVVDQLDVPMVDVSISCGSQDFSIHPFDANSSGTRASDKSATNVNVNSIALTVLDGETVLNSITQTKSSAGDTFGTFNLSLPIGTHTFVIIAHFGNTPASITSGTQATISADEYYCYCLVQDITLTSQSADQPLTIDMGRRKNSMFRINTSDETPADVAKLRLTVSPSASAPATSVTINPSSGLATQNLKYVRTVSKPTDGSFKGKNVGIQFFLTEATQTLDVLVEALSTTDKVLYSRQFTGLTFKQGESITATGQFFKKMGGSLTFDDGYNDNPITF